MIRPISSGPSPAMTVLQGWVRRDATPERRSARPPSGSASARCSARSSAHGRAPGCGGSAATCVEQRRDLALERPRPRGASRPAAPEHAVRHAPSTTSDEHARRRSTRPAAARADPSRCSGRAGVGAVAGQRGAGVGGDLRGQLGRLVDDARPRRGEATSRRAQARSAVRTVTASPPGGSSTGVHLVDRVVLGHPAGAAGQPQPHGRRPGLGLVDAVVDVPPVGLRRRGGGLVEDDDVVDPVEAEQPHALDPAAPRLEVPAAVDQQQPHRVDVALGPLVAGGHVVVQVQGAACAPAPSRTTARVSSRASTLTATGVTRSAACPAAADTLASARLTASRSARPGSSSRVRSATTSATASSVVSRSGRTMPAVKVTRTRSPSKERSMRSPGP